MSILDKIIAQKRAEVAALRSAGYYAALAAMPTPAPAPSLVESIKRSPTGVIAEFKRRSPSRGLINADAEVEAVVGGYAAAGAAAASILTDTPYFGGSIADLARARAAAPGLALLRKEFIVDPDQLLEARKMGASAVLLIASVLDRDTISALAGRAHGLGLETLVEIHSLDELDRIAPGAADLVGVNSRNLADMTTDLSHAAELAAAVGERLPEATLVAESGIRSLADIDDLRSRGYSAFLIGERLMGSDSPADALREVLQGENRVEAGEGAEPKAEPSPLHAEMMIKVCGMKDEENIRRVAALTPMMMGFIFYRNSPRYAGGLRPEVVASLPKHIRAVGVFVDAPVEEVAETCVRYGIRIAQLHGSESPEMCAELRRRGLTVFKAIAVADAADLRRTLLYDGCVDMFVLDTKSSLPGGSGRKFDHRLLAGYPSSTPYLLGGGIGPDDVDLVVESMRPRMAGIDINSRFEQQPGVKDLAKLIKFVVKLRSYNEYESDYKPFWEK